MWHVQVIGERKRLLRGKGFQEGDELYRESLESTSYLSETESRERFAENLYLGLKAAKDRVDYAAWMKFIREQRRRKKKLPSGANYKWIAWQQKQKDVQPRAQSFGRTLSRKELLALQQAEEMKHKTSSISTGNANEAVEEKTL